MLPSRSLSGGYFEKTYRGRYKYNKSLSRSGFIYSPGGGWGGGYVSIIVICRGVWLNNGIPYWAGMPNRLFVNQCVWIYSTHVGNTSVCAHVQTYSTHVGNTSVCVCTHVGNTSVCVCTCTDIQYTCR